MNIRNQRAMRTKENLKNAAIDLFRENGFYEVTVDQIIKNSSSSKGAFYTHFKSKQEIFIEVFQTINSYYLNKVINSIDPNDTCEAKIINYFHAKMNYIEKHLGVDIVQTILAAELSSESRSFLLSKGRPSYLLLKEIFTEGQQNGEFRNDISVENMLSMIIRFMNGIFYDWALNNGIYSPAKENIFILELIIFNLKKR